jgi:Nuclease-related domain
MSDVGEIAVVRWRRYGKDRLYANAVDGSRVGWVDLQTGDVVVEQPGLEHACSEAFASFAAAEGLTLPEAATLAPVTASVRAAPAALESATDMAASVPSVQPAGEPSPSPPPVAAAAVTILPGSPTVTSPSPVPPGATTTAVNVVPEQRDNEPPWVDLAANRPGQDLAKRAAELRREAPIRTTLARVLGVHTGERAMRIGAKGERLVAARLDGLGDGWHVLHAINVRRDRETDVDHVVVGPGGVYCLNTKNRPEKKIIVRGDSFRTNGYREYCVKASRAEARKATRLLSAACGRSVLVHPLIVVVGAYLEVRQQPTDVTVLRRKDVARWLRRRPVTLLPDEVESIFEQARRSTTWLPKAG